MMKCLIGGIGKMEIRQIALEIAQLVEKKNHDYDNSFDKTMDKYGDTASFLDKLINLFNLSSILKK